MTRIPIDAIILFAANAFIMASTPISVKEQSERSG